MKELNELVQKIESMALAIEDDYYEGRLENLRGRCSKLEESIMEVQLAIVPCLGSSIEYSKAYVRICDAEKKVKLIRRIC